MSSDTRFEQELRETEKLRDIAKRTSNGYTARIVLKPVDLSDVRPV
jgi:hypothetical protein